MLQILSCRNCGSSTYHMDAVTIHLNMSKSQHCGHCRQSQENKNLIFFCSPKCMLVWISRHQEDFLKEVAKFRAGRMWDGGFNPPPDSGENPSIQEVGSSLSKEKREEILKRNICCTTHCCIKHRCKYGLIDCPVMLGLCPTNYCEDCGVEEEEKDYYGPCLH